MSKKILSEQTRRQITALMKKGATYEELNAALPPMHQHAVNEKLIWAVNQLDDGNGHVSRDTEAFLRAQASQLVFKWSRLGFSSASKRFRDAVWKFRMRRHKEAKTPEIDDSPYAGSPCRQSVPKNDLLSIAKKPEIEEV